MRSLQAKFLPTAALLLFSACGGGGGSSSPRALPPGSGGPDLGTVSVISATTCPRGPGLLADTTCMHLLVDDLGVPSIEVELRVTEPDAGTSLRGTVVLGTGLFGNSFYVDEAGGSEFIPSLTASGFRVVDRAWVSGWFASGSSIMPQSARYAAMITWVKDNLHTGGAFCVSGNSGGAGEISYALSTWERADMIDVALLTSGPPITRLDYLCQNPPTPEWLAICRSIVPPGSLECGEVQCTVVAGNPLCAMLPPTPQPGELEADSLLNAESTLDYPNTVVHALLGAQDCSIAVPQALMFMNAITSPTSFEFVSGAPHLMPTTAGGRAAMLQVLLDATAGTPAPTIQTRFHETPLGELRTVTFEQERSL